MNFRNMNFRNMNFRNINFGNIKSITPVDAVLLILFIIYLVFPIATPDFLAGVIDTPLGMIIIFAITISLFVYTNPILGILCIFVAYELLRRSSKQTGASAYVQYTPTQAKRNQEMKNMNPPAATSLEEEIVQKMAPIGHSDKNVYIESSFKPVNA